HPDIFIPKLRPGFDKIPHQLDAGWILQDFHFDALRANIFFRSLEGHILADNDAWNFIKQRRTTAHRTRGQRGIKYTALVNRRGEASGIFEAVHFRVANHAAVLHALVMAAPDDFAIAYEHGA